MSERKRCKDCNGSGKVLGGGMMQTECDTCEGRGRIEVIKDEIEELNKRSEERIKRAITEIKASYSKISDEEAKKIFDEELEKIEKENNSDKRKKK